MGSSGGGGTGAEIPAYIQEIHAWWLDGRDITSDDDFIDGRLRTSMVIALNQAHDNNPFREKSAYTPYEHLLTMGEFLSEFKTETLDDEITFEKKLDDLITALQAVETTLLGLTAPTTGTDVATTLAGIDVAALGTALDDLSTILDTAETAVQGYDTLVTSMSLFGNWQEAIGNAAYYLDNHVINNAYILDDVETFAENYDSDIETNVLPQFEIGARDVNAVLSSTFVVGKAQIWASRDRDIARYHAELRTKLHAQRNDMAAQAALAMLDHLQKKVQAKAEVSRQWSGLVATNLQVAQTRITIEQLSTQIAALQNEADNLLLKGFTLKIEQQRVASTFYSVLTELTKLYNYIDNLRFEYARLGVDVERMSLIAKKEYVDQQQSIDENGAKWPLQTFQHAANMIAAYSGGTAPSPKGQPSTTSSAIGGALSGAALGAQIGGSNAGYGAAIGGAAGLVAGLFSS